MKECKHPTCGDTCRRPKKERKVYTIKKVSKKRVLINGQLSRLSKEIRSERPLCEIRSPVCTGRAQGVHHKKGRGKYILDRDKLLSACNPCNLYVEEHPAWALENGFIEKKNY